MLGHDALAVVDILNGVLRLSLFDDRILRNSLSQGEHGHDVGFDELVVGWATSEDEMRSNPGFELSNTFEGAFPLFGRRRSVGVGWVAEDDDGIEVGEIGVGGGDAAIDQGGGDTQNNYECSNADQEFAHEMHE